MKEPKSRLLVPVLRAALITTAAVFIILGLMQGEQNVVLNKAVRICLECIGIG